jgi:hypothetical protein
MNTAFWAAATVALWAALDMILLAAAQIWQWRKR